MGERHYGIVERLKKIKEWSANASHRHNSPGEIAAHAACME